MIVLQVATISAKGCQDANNIELLMGLTLLTKGLTHKLQDYPNEKVLSLKAFTVGYFGL